MSDHLKVTQICQEAIDFGFASVCIPPFFVKAAKQALKGSRGRTATVIGFPMGYSSTAAKVEEIKRAIGEGAHEVDVVINVCAVKCADWMCLQFAA